MSNPKQSILALSALTIGFSIVAVHAASTSNNQHKMQNHGSMDHSQMSNAGAYQKSGTKEAGPKEAGQSAFATIAEIVAILQKDPATDWSNVNISALREHLVDMDALTLKAKAAQETSQNTITFTVTGSGRVRQAIQTMVSAHSGVLAATFGWSVKSHVTEEGAVMAISSDNPSALKTIKALGFFGVMAMGAHHQAHHLAMAKGDTSVHGSH